MHRHRFASFLLFAGCLHAQDMVAIGAAGGVFSVDSNTLAVAPTGPGRRGMHGLATDGVSCWACETIDASRGRLVLIDPTTGTAATLFDILNYPVLTWAGAPTRGLYGVRAVTITTLTSRAFLDRIDLRTGQSTQVATWALMAASPTGLAEVQGMFYCWDSLAGMLRIDPGTGAVTQLFGVGLPTPLRFLCRHPDGRFLCGLPFGPATNLGQIDLTTGVVNTLGRLTTTELSGCVAPGNRRISIGQACADVAGPATLQLLGSCFTGTTATAVSTNHALGTIGAMIFGWSTTSHAGQPLPLLLDPLLGTHGCHLYVSIDASLLGPTPMVPPGDLVFQFRLPPASVGLSFAVQHAAFAPVPGLMSWSNAIELTVQQ